MGARGNATPPRPPTEKPTFTLSQLKKAIPPHCFQRSLLRFFLCVISDITAVFILYYLADNYIDQLPNHISYFAWLIYAYVQGCAFGGIWFLAHECGHNAMSDYPWLDDIIGFFLHSIILFPYFSFKFSHRRHHLNCASIEKDEAFVPKRKTSTRWFSKYLIHPSGRAFNIFLSLSIGLHMYISVNLSGRKYEGFASHYNPYAPIYSSKERLHIYASDAGVLAMAYILYRVASVRGTMWLMCIYGGPFVVMSAYVVVVTMLHHTHPSLPHYETSEWDWLRGALSTVDRNYGKILNKVFHHVVDTHVVHHLFSTIPHYHAVEATEAIKPILGKYYTFDGTPVHKALWREFKECIYVEMDEEDMDKGVLWYKNKL